MILTRLLSLKYSAPLMLMYDLSNYLTCMREGVKQLVLSVCHSVKKCEISTFTRLNNAVRGDDLIDTKAVHFCAFPALFYLTLVLSTILIRSTTSIWWRPGICGPQARVHVHHAPRSQDCEKLGGGLETRLHTHLICGQLHR